MTVAALVMGNTVVVKPSSDTPTVAAKFAEVLLEAGFPVAEFLAADRKRRLDRRRARVSSENPLRRPSLVRETSVSVSMNWRRKLPKDNSGLNAS